MRYPLKFLKKLFVPAPSRWPPRPADGVICYAVGDIHGSDALLREMHILIEQDARRYERDRPKWVVYLGDYVDKGRHSRKVVDILASGPPEGFSAKYLKGNHEEAFLTFLDDPNFLPTWRSLGGLATLASYGVGSLPVNPDEKDLREYRDRFLQVIPDAHLQFLSSLENFWRSGDIVFVHAGIRPNLEFESQNEHDFLWIREPFLSSVKDLGAYIVHGHSTAYRVDCRQNRMGIDTGAYATGILSCAVFDGGNPRVITARGRLSPEYQVPVPGRSD